MMGKHSGFVCQLSARCTQGLAARVAVVHNSWILLATVLITVGAKDFLLTVGAAVDKKLQQTVFWWKGIISLEHGWKTTEGAVETIVTRAGS